MNTALLDTDIVSEIGKSKDATVAGHAKTYRRSFGHYTLSTVTVMEIMRGFQKAQATARLNAFLATLPHMELFSFDQATAELAGKIAGELETTSAAAVIVGVHGAFFAWIAFPGGLTSGMFTPQATYECAHRIENPCS